MGIELGTAALIGSIVGGGAAVKGAYDANKAKKDQAGAQGRAERAQQKAEQDAAMGVGAEMMKRKKTARQSSLLSSTDPLSGAKKTLLGE
jgi:hypothetical protein